MTFTKIAIAIGVVLFGFVCWLAVSGVGAAREGLVSLVALVALVAGGNLLSGWARPAAKRSTAVTRAPAAAEPASERSPGDEPAS
ncbi:MAG: hypothetical protein ACP5PM_03440 [Acidimicrobiales bacterium]